MTFLKSDDLLEPQVNWYRSQVRLPKTLSEQLKKYVDETGLPLNTAFMKLIDRGLANQFHVVSNYAGTQNVVVELPTAVIALTPDYYSELTLQKGVDEWMVSYHGLKAVVSNEEAKQMLDIGFKEISYNKYQFTKKRKVIFTSWNAVDAQDQFDREKETISYNEAVRMSCANFMSSFFQKNPSYKLIQIDFKKGKTKKGNEYIYGAIIWYSYPSE